MINTTLLHQEKFLYKLVKGETKQISEKKLVLAHGFFNRKDTFEIVLVDHDTYIHNEYLLSTFPTDVVKLIMDEQVSDEGYHTWNWRLRMSTSDSKLFTRDFSYTLNDFYKINNITKDNLINIEYCKCDCNITGAYITWDDGK